MVCHLNPAAETTSPFRSSLRGVSDVGWPVHLPIDQHGLNQDDHFTMRAGRPGQRSAVGRLSRRSGRLAGMDVTPIGLVESARAEPLDDDWDAVAATVRLDPQQFTEAETAPSRSAGC